MRSRFALGLGAVALLAAVLFYGQSDRRSSGRAELNFSQTTIARAQPGFPPALTDERRPVAPTARTVDLCGYGQITVQPEDHPYPQQVRVAARDALARITDALANDADLGKRAIALSLGATMKGAAAAESVRAQLPPNCEESPECTRRLYEASAAALRQDADQLATSVAATRDGRAYATALYLCDRAYAARSGAGPCARLSAAQWAALEPDNVIPWLVDASRAMASGDRTAQEAAMRGAARATSSRLYEGGPLALVDHPDLARLPSPVRMATLTDLIGNSAAIPLPPLLAASQHCGKGVAMDEARRRDCSAIAEALLTGSSLIEVSLGTAFGRIAGWPEEKVRSLQEKLDAFEQVTSSPIWDTDDYWSCGFLETLQEHAVRLARYGEVGVAEQAIKQTGKSPSELAEQRRERFKARQKDNEESRR